MRILMAHHLDTGLTVRPCWGPMHGDEAVSEQGLTEKILLRLPAGSAVMADRNFAVFPVAWAAQQAQCGVLMRMTKARAKKIAGHILPPAGSARMIEWKPSRDDRRAHPELPKEAVVRGRLIVAHIPAENGQTQPLYLFTSLEESVEEIGGTVPAAVEHRTRYSFAEKDPENGQPALKNIGNDGKRVAGSRCRI